MRAGFLSRLLAVASFLAVLADPVISTYPNVLKLSTPFNPLKDAYWTAEIHHRRSVLAVSPNNEYSYYAYLDAGLKEVYVQRVNPETFVAIGTPFSVEGAEAGGLVVHDDGSFALLTNVAPHGSPVPPNNFPIAALIKVENGVEVWRALLNGPSINSPEGVSKTSMRNLRPDFDSTLRHQISTGMSFGPKRVNYMGHTLSSLAMTETRMDTSATVYSTLARMVYAKTYRKHRGGDVRTVSAMLSKRLMNLRSALFAQKTMERMMHSRNEAQAETNATSVWLNTIGGGMSTEGTKIAGENTTQGTGGEPCKLVTLMNRLLHD